MTKARRAACALLVAAALLPSASASAGPWAPEQGHGYAKVWVKYLLGFGFSDSDGSFSNYQSYHELFVASYGELGLGRRVSLWWQTDLVRAFFLRDPNTGRQSHAGIGDPALGLAYQLVQRASFALGVRGAVRVPFARDEPVQTVFERRRGGDGEFDAVGELRIGEGAVGMPFSLEVGYSFGAWYLAGSAGYEVRLAGYDDRILWSVEGGRDFGNFRGRVRLSGAHSIRRGSAERVNTPSGQGNGVSYAGAAVEAERHVGGDTYVGASIEGGIGGLRSQSGGPVVSVYVATTF